MKRFTALFLALLSLVLLTACHNGEGGDSSGPAQVDYPVTIGEFVIEKAPARVVVLSESLADVVVTLGSGFEVKLVGRSDECTQQELAVLPTVGTEEAPSVESIQELEADLVLAGQALPEETTAALEAQGIQVMVQPPATTRAEFETLYTNVGSVLLGGKNGYEAARARAEKIFLSIDDISRLIPEEEKTYTACLVLDENGTLATATTLAGSLLEYAGAINIAAEETSAEMTKSELQTADPYFIFCREGLKETVLADERFAGLTAVAEGRIYEVESVLLDRQGESVLDLVIALAKVMHPTVDDSTASQIEGEPAESGSSEVSSQSASSSTGQPSGLIPTRVDESSSRQEILALQERLIALGYMQPPGDGTYGYWTKETVKVFQEKAGLTTTGIADEETVKALFAEDAPRQ